MRRYAVIRIACDDEASWPAKRILTIRRQSARSIAFQSASNDEQRESRR
jgi:hypothetical protein